MVCSDNFEIQWICFLKIPEGVRPFFLLPPSLFPSLPYETLSHGGGAQSQLPPPRHRLNDGPKVTRCPVKKRAKYACLSPENVIVGSDTV